MAANLELATTIPKGSWVLVTGATGYIAGHVVNQFLSRGYRVRGTARSLSNAQWLVKELYQKEVAAGDFKLVEIPDMAADGAYDEAIRGVSAVAHIATDTSLSPDPNKVIPQTLAGVTNLLRAAAAEPSVEQFVYTSSMAAVRIPVPGVVFHVDQNTWNDAALAQAWAPPPYDSSRSIIVYAASKVEAERAVWKFVKEEKPAFAVNVVLPFTAFGPVLHEKQNTSTAALLLGLFNGKVTPQHLGMPAARYIHVHDTALMHVAAILDPEVSSHRIHTWSDAFNWNDVLATFRRLYPSKTFPANLENMGQFLGTVDDKIGRELMKKWDGRDSWRGLEEGIKDTLSGKIPAQLGGAFGS